MSAYRYGLTEGNYKSELIGLTSLGESLTAPRDENERVDARRRAFRSVEIFQQIFTHFQNNRLPAHSFFKNTVERDPFRIPPEWSEEIATAFRVDATYVGYVRAINGQEWVVSTEGPPATPSQTTDDEVLDGGDQGEPSPLLEEMQGDTVPDSVRSPLSLDRPANRKVFISHGRNQDIVEQIKKIVTFGKFEPIASVERMTVSKPVPEKVMDDMRSCFAGVIHVATEDPVATADGTPVRPINDNVLIEIGAAMALYGRNVILLVENGTQMPSNLQGLFEVRYSGDKLDGDATMRLLQAFNDFEEQIEA